MFDFAGCVFSVLKTSDPYAVSHSGFSNLFAFSVNGFPRVIFTLEKVESNLR